MYLVDFLYLKYFCFKILKKLMILMLGIMFIEGSIKINLNGEIN